MLPKSRSHSNGNLVAGTTLVAASAISIFAMAHHPSGGHGHGKLNLIVHGTMIFVLIALLFGFGRFALGAGLKHSLVLAGLIAYSVTAVTNVVAAMINGFVAPAVNAHGTEKIGHDILIFCWEANQASAKLGVVAAAFAFAFWGIHLIGKKAMLERLVGFFGIIAGVVPAIFMVFVSQEMDLKTALIVYVTHAVWTLMVGAMLICRRGARGESQSTARTP